MPSATLRLGTRGSQLALWQAHAVADRIAAAGGPPSEIIVVKTSGDRLQEAPLSEVGGKRLFVKELEDALLNDAIDLAVHSSKDMPAVLPPGLTIAAVLPREDPHDAVVLPSGGARRIDSLDDLTETLGLAPTIATSSVRRVAQLRGVFAGARFEPIRGNLDTRLRKLDAGPHDALVLAAAGLIRLGAADRISMKLPATVCVPAPGQGIVAVQIREDDAATRKAVEPIGHPPTHAALRAERAVVEALGGGCQIPLGVLAMLTGEHTLHLVAAVITLNGERAIRASEAGPVTDAALLGARVAAELERQGAADVLDASRNMPGPVAGTQP